MLIRYAKAPTKQIRVNGETYAYRELGPDSGESIVMLHHYTAVLDDWDPAIVDGFAARYRVLVFDNRGVGGSTGEVASSIEEMADDAVAFIKAMGLSTTHLFGFSMGGFIAQTIALEYPELVDKLILTGTGPSSIMDDANVIFPLVEEAVVRAEEENKHPKHFLLFCDSPASQSAANGFLARLESRTENDRVPRITAQARGAHVAAIMSWATEDKMNAGQIQHPTFIANGDSDIMVPTKYSFKLHEMIPNSRLTIYPDAGHGGIFQYHDLFIWQALEFLGET